VGALPDEKRMTTAQGLAGLLLVVFGVTIIFLSWLKGPPNAEELVPVEGPLLAYSGYRTNSRNGSFLVLFRLGGHPGRFWNDAVKNGSAGLLNGHTGEVVRVMYDPHAHLSPIDGDAVKSYGLWINGVELASAEDAVNTDHVLAHVVLPALGLLSAAIGFVRVRKWRRQEEAPFPPTA
jgi:hypothetical protein